MLRLLVDNDVLIKAAHWGLLDHIPEFAGASWTETTVLESLAHRARRSDRKLFKEAGVASALSQRLAQTTPLPAPDVAVVRDLQGAVSIDAGEVALIGVLCSNEDAILLTGDKRALTALAAPNYAHIRSRINGRVTCLEQFLGHVLDQIGAVELVQGVNRYRDLDTAVRCIVGRLPDVTEARLREGLASYISDLFQQSAGVLRV